MMFNRIDFEAIGNGVRRFAVGKPHEFGLALERIATGSFIAAQLVRANAAIFVRTTGNH
jgi:hypothetical protein